MNECGEWTVNRCVHNNSRRKETKYWRSRQDTTCCYIAFILSAVIMCRGRMDTASFIRKDRNHLTANWTGYVNHARLGTDRAAGNLLVTQTVNTEESFKVRQDMLLNLQVSSKLENFFENVKYEFHQENNKQYVKTGHKVVKTCISHQLNAQFLYSLITSVTLYSSTCFEHRCAHLQEERKLYAYSIWYRHTGEQ